VINSEFLNRISSPRANDRGVVRVGPHRPKIVFLPRLLAAVGSRSGFRAAGLKAVIQRVSVNAN
jgi:hypothetical protein